VNKCEHKVLNLSVKYAHIARTFYSHLLPHEPGELTLLVALLHETACQSKYIMQTYTVVGLSTYMFMPDAFPANQPMRSFVKYKKKIQILQRW